MPHPIDVTFDFRTDTPEGKDPDTFSPTLRAYHKLLWSKNLPGGAPFTLIDRKPYLYHNSDIGEFFLASDSVIPSFSREPKMANIIKQVPAEEVSSFNTIGYTIGGMMVFPGERIENKMTINGARGFHPRIKDRFDLTLECIRRHYLDQQSPLSEVLLRYAAFFALFVDFENYVRFFLLDDLVTADYRNIQSFTTFDNFQSSPLPQSVASYSEYKDRAIKFIRNRNARIKASI